MSDEYRKWEDMREPGRLDVNGVEWWACDPYPTWFRWDEVDGKQVLNTRHARFADLPDVNDDGVRAAEDCYGHDNHSASCDQVIKPRWSGVRCDCGARWYCA